VIKGTGLNIDILFIKKGIGNGQAQDQLQYLRRKYQVLSTSNRYIPRGELKRFMQKIGVKSIFVPKKYEAELDSIRNNKVFEIKSLPIRQQGMREKIQRVLGKALEDTRLAGAILLGHGEAFFFHKARVEDRHNQALRGIGRGGRVLPRINKGDED